MVAQLVFSTAFTQSVIMLGFPTDKNLVPIHPGSTVRQSYHFLLRTRLTVLDSL